MNRSVLVADPSLFTDIGMPGIDGAYPVPGGVALGRGIVPNGAILEDGNTTNDTTRVFNHFYDVQYNNFAGRGMDILNGPGPLLFRGNPSPTWALEDTGDLNDMRNGLPQVFSFRQSQQYYQLALTSSTDELRRTYFGKMLESVGHVVHHIQDMAQPQHVRNDQHVHPIPLTNYNPPWSHYEGYSERMLTRERIVQLVANAGYPIPTFATSREFFHTPGVAAARYTGMGEFTSNNYVSFGKNFRGSWGTSTSVTILANAFHPYPGSVNADGSAKFVQTHNVTVTLPNNVQRSGPVDFVMGKVYDQYLNQHIDGQRLAEVSVTDMVASGSSYSAVSGRANVFKDNSVVYDDQHKILVPRAVAFSAGMINHMFRGRLEMTRSSPTSPSWTITNRSRTVVNGQMVGQAINGRILLYYDNAQNQRVQMPGAGGQNVNLPYGGTVTIGNTEPPSGTQKVIAVFTGRIGNEGDPAGDAGSGFYAVAGKVIPYNNPTLPCGGTVSYVGDTTPWTQEMDLGSDPGPVQVEFEAYSVPDRLDIRRSSNNSSIYTTGALVPGFHQTTFQHAGGQNAAQNKIKIQVTPNTSGTVWTTTVGCPNEVLNNSHRMQDRIKVSFEVVKPTGFCNSGDIKFYLDGTHVGTVILPGGASTFPGTDATVGPTHHVRAVTSIPNPVFGCGGILQMRYYDRQGAHNFSAGGETVEFK